MSSPPTTGRPRATIGFWLSAAAGWAIIGFGLRGALHHHLDTRPADLARFVVAGALVHDLLFAPLVLALGVLISRAVPAAVRDIVQAGLIVTGSLVLFSYPLVRGYAHVLHNPTSLPHNYAANLAVVVAGVWAMAVGVALIRLLRGRHS